MASVEERLNIIEQYIANSRTLNQMPFVNTLNGTETVAIYSSSINTIGQYPLADILAGGTIDPTNDVKVKYVNFPNPDFTQPIENQIASYINISPSFDKTPNELVLYVATRKAIDTNNSIGWSFYREAYVLNVVKGTYGTASGNTILSTDLVYQGRALSNDSNTQLIQIGATLPYNIQDVVNTSIAFTPTQGGNIVIEIQISGTGNQYWLYQGQTEQDLGTGGYVTTAGDYIDLSNATPDSGDSVDVESQIQAYTQDRIGFMDYNDTTGTISVVANTWTDIPNNGAGAFSNTAYKPNLVTDIIDTSTGYLDFSDLTLGSQIIVRNDFKVIPSVNNTLLELRYVLGQGANEYALLFWSERLDNGSGIEYQRVPSFPIYMGDLNTLGGVGKLQIRLSNTSDVINAGSYINIQIR